MESLVCSETYKGLVSTVGQSMMSELLDRVAQDLHAVAAELVAARATGNEQAIRAASHKLISVAGAFGARRLQPLALRLHGAASAGTDRERPELLDACLEEIEAVLEFIRGRRTSCS